MREPTVQTEQPAPVPRDSLPDAMRIAAARRSRGENWPEISRDLDRPEREICRWPIWMADEWTPIYARAEADAVERAAALALVRLVDVVQNLNERNSIEAARTILVHRRQLLRIEKLGTADARGLTPITDPDRETTREEGGSISAASAFICGSEDLELLNATREASALALAKLVELLECGDDALALGAARAILLYRRQLLRWTYSPRPGGYPSPRAPNIERTETADARGYTQITEEQLPVREGRTPELPRTTSADMCSGFAMNGEARENQESAPTLDRRPSASIGGSGIPGPEHPP